MQNLLCNSERGLEIPLGKEGKVKSKNIQNMQRHGGRLQPKMENETNHSGRKKYVAFKTILCSP
jgi:hypothetical protein